MGRKIAVAVGLVLCGLLPAGGDAAADGGSDAVVQDVSMLVEAHLTSKDVWAPGGRELRWEGAKCPIKIQFKGQVQVDKPTKITYRWERTEGPEPAQTFEVKTLGAMVEIAPIEMINVGKPGVTYRGSETLHVTAPTDMVISTPFRVMCQ